MLKRIDFHNYQNSLIAFAKFVNKCGLFVDMGLGKTVTTLTIILDFYNDFFIDRILIVAPLRVANTVWKQEALKWEHLKDLDIGICTGTATNRNLVIRKKHVITVINKENIPWLCENHKWIWDMVVIDESTGFKNPKAKRFKHIKNKMKYVKSLILLTGTPTPNGLLDLWSQIFLIDSGERLGKNMTMYKSRFFKPTGYMGYQFKPLPGAEDKIKELIKDVCITMKSEDYLELPDKIDLYEYIEMPSNIKDQYEELEKEFILSLDSGIDIEAPSASGLHNKLLQFCNGAMYDTDKKWHEIHNLKIEALKELIEENPGENFLIAYNYKSDLERLKKAFPKMVVLSKSGDELEEWNKGNIRMLACHPASAGHGLNAQYGGSILIWFGLNWSLELYQQLNKRLHRQGQTKPVRIIHLIMKGGMDEKVMLAITSKAQTQDELIEYLKFILKK